MTTLIDPDEFPFTTEEVYRAASKFMPTRVAREVADHLTECGPGLIDARAERRSTWQAAGIPNAGTLSLHGWVYPDELLPALASLSADALTRATRLAAEQWQSGRAAALQSARHAAAEQAGIIPSNEELLRLAEAADPSTSGRDRMAAGLAVTLPPLPLPTPAMIDMADSYVAEKQAAWRAAVAHFQDI